MAFSTSASVISTNLDNMLRGLYRDNADHAVTGTTSETDMASTTITGGTIGATGALLVIASGTITNSASGAKTIKLYLGATAIVTVSRTAANAQDWAIWCLIANTSEGAQRITAIYSTTDAATSSINDTTAAIDTSTNAILKLTGTLASGSDTITGTIFDVLEVQIQ